jgi:hypothetical protein
VKNERPWSGWIFDLFAALFLAVFGVKEWVSRLVGSVKRWV